MAPSSADATAGEGEGEGAARDAAASGGVPPAVNVNGAREPSGVPSPSVAERLGKKKLPRELRNLAMLDRDWKVKPISAMADAGMNVEAAARPSADDERHGDGLDGREGGVGGGGMGAVGAGGGGVGGGLDEARHGENGASHDESSTPHAQPEPMETEAT